MITDILTYSYRSLFDLALSQTQNWLIIAKKAYQGPLGYHQWMLRHLDRGYSIDSRLKAESVLLTVYALLFETVDTLMNLSCSVPRLFLHESLQPLPGYLDVLDRKKILDKFDCIALSKVTHQRERTHAIVAA